MGIIATKVNKWLGSQRVHVLKDISLQIHEGDFIALTGRSGSGKSSLLYLLSSLDKVTQGSILIDNEDVSLMNEKTLSKFRNEKMGYVFQFHYLLLDLSAEENVLFPAKKSGEWQAKKAYAEYLLEKMGLKDKMHRFPRELSGGEQQRVAIARSLIMKPKYLFADEPTGALDSINGDLVMQMLLEVNNTFKTTVVLVTHDQHFASLAKRQIHLADGKILQES